MLNNVRVRRDGSTPSPSERESQLLGDIFRAVYPYIFVTRINVGSVPIGNGKRFSTGAPAGYTDLSGNMRDGSGRAVYIEVKLPDGVVSDKQAAFMAARHNEGAVVGVARSVDDALRIIGIVKN